MNFSQLPNALTISRIILTVPIVYYLLKEQYPTALIILLIAGGTDSLDGWVAKRFNFQSRLGSILDPLADKILLISSFVTLFILNLIPSWLLIAIVLRDVLIVAGTVGYAYALDKKEQQLLEPSNLSKLNTALQITLLLFLVIDQLILIDQFWINASWLIIFTSTILSGIDYAWIWLKHVIFLEKNK
jgi:cardiolipin synthase